MIRLVYPNPQLCCENYSKLIILSYFKLGRQMETKFGLDLVLGSVVLNQVMPDSNLINGTDFSEVVKVRKKKQ